MKAWLKGGLIALGIWIILVGVVVICSFKASVISTDSFKLHFIQIIWTILVLYPCMFIFTKTGSVFVCNIFGLIINLILFFILGAVIGLIVGKIRNKKAIRKTLDS